MGFLGGLFVAVMAASVVYLVAHAAAQSRGRAWREAAKRVGLTELVTSDFLGIETGITGRAGMLRVTLERYQRGRHERGTRVVIDGLGHPSYEFALRKEGVGSAIEKAFGEREIELGDDHFDRLAYIHGSPRVVHAVLDAETRSLVGDLIDGRMPVAGAGEGLKARVAVSDGALRAEIPEGAFSPGGKHLPQALETLLTAARSLALPDDVPQRLRDNLRTEPLPTVRLSNLLTLNREYPGYDVTREALRASCEDPDPEVRLRAALVFGDEGREVLREIAAGAESTDGQAARAVSALGGHLAREDAETILQQALAAKRRGTAAAAIQALGQVGGDDVVESLAAALKDDSDDLVVAAARALGDTGSPAAEAPLIAALDRDGPAVWPAVAEALGKVGSAAAVAPLRNMAGRFPFDLSLRRASRQAIAEIQARLTGATPGQLALADGGSGQLSLAEEGLEGRVSMAAESESAAEGEAQGDDEGGTEDDTQWPTDAQGAEVTASEEDASTAAGGHPPPRLRDED